MVVGKLGALYVAQAINEYVQGTFRRGAGVQLTQRPRGRVSWVGVRGFATRHALLVEQLELRLREVDLAPDLHRRRYVAVADPKGYALDGPKVEGDVFPNHSVSPGRALNEDTVFISQGDRQSVVLQLADEVDVLTLQHTCDSPVPCHELIVIEGVSEAVHGTRVPDLLEALSRFRTNALGRRVRSNELRMLLFNIDKLFDEGVVPSVADFGLVQHVVQVIVLVDFVTKLRCSTGGLLSRHGLTSHERDLKIIKGHVADFK